MDLTRLSEEELRDVNRRILGRLRPIRSARQLVDLARFSVEMRVEFTTDHGRTLQGEIARMNRKTLYCTPSGHWRVSPALLRPIVDRQTYRSSTERVVPISANRKPVEVHDRRRPDGGLPLVRRASQPAFL